MGIRLNDVKVVFRGPRGDAVPVLDIPQFAVDEGHQVALVGGSGSGKTTLLNVIAGIVRPTSGEVRVGETDVATLSEAGRDVFRAKNVGYVFQTFNLLQGLTALENVLLAQSFAGVRGKAALERGRALLDRVRLSDRHGARPGTMSVGEQQRVAIARALVNRPRIVLADEPTANLDEDNGDQVLDLLQEATREEGSILLLVTHERRVQERFANVVPLAELNR